jgi:hypothetical protein
MVPRKYALIYSLLFLWGSLLSFIPSANAQACTPVVYAFRHAEDSGTNLTLVGRQHADLYPAMVDRFGAEGNYCPVGFVYSMYEINPDGGAGTNNPFQTAQPLADSACINRVLPKCILETMHVGDCIGTLCSGSATQPSTALVTGGRLYEYLGAAKAELGTPRAGRSATPSELRDELKSNAVRGLSSAIFWSSQGLNVLGQAIADKDIVDIPGCSEPPAPGTKCDKGKAPRNAAYAFKFNGANAFDLIAPGNKFVQCFDVQIKKFCIPGTIQSTPPELDGPPTVSPTGETAYWCGNGDAGNLPATSGLTPECDQTLPSTFNNLDMLQGKICDTFNLIGTGPRGYYGYCQ